MFFVGRREKGSEMREYYRVLVFCVSLGCFEDVGIVTFKSILLFYLGKKLIR